MRKIESAQGCVSNTAADAVCVSNVVSLTPAQQRRRFKLIEVFMHHIIMNHFKATR